jgi:hypothetical protein
LFPISEKFKFKDLGKVRYGMTKKDFMFGGGRTMQCPACWRRAREVEAGAAPQLDFFAVKIKIGVGL